MVAHRRKDLVKSRRRVDDGEEEEVGSDVAPLEDDSLSEATELSELEDEDGDADGSEISEQHDAADAKGSSPKTKKSSKGSAVGANGVAAKTKKSTSDNNPVKDGAVPAGTDTEIMMNGMQVPEGAVVEEIHFDDGIQEGVANEETPSVDAASTEPTTESASTAQKTESVQKQHRQTQDEYRQKRDADPTFVPNRGGFFMHDHRHAGPGANGFRPFGKGRGRGRGVGGGMLSDRYASQAPEPTNEPWAHDLHDTTLTPKKSTPARGAPSGSPSRQAPGMHQQAGPQRSFSRTTHVGNVQIRVLLPQMQEPIVFSGVPVKQHTRLPQHRPPLRRDKPVRISLPDHPPRYIFPATERSFVFIPRALRPNQQGYGRGGRRGGFGSYRGGPSSRQTSTYGGRSIYSPSVSMSRRSSMAAARDMTPTQDPLRSATDSVVSRPPAALPEPSRPIVRLPPAPETHHESPIDPLVMSVESFTDLMRTGDGFHAPTMPALPPHMAYQNYSASLPMHQPRPQKTVSVAGIDSPERMAFPPPPLQQEQQPFHQQVPHEVNGSGYPHDGLISHHPPHSRGASYPSQPSAGTPLSHIPDRAIHAQPFQPQGYPMPGYGPVHHHHHPPHGAAPPHPMYYPAPDPRMAGYPPMVTSSGPSGPIYVPMMSMGHHGAAPPPPHPPHPSAAGPGGTVAQESNGMVYYYDAAQLYGAGGGGYPAATYAVAPPGGVVGMGGMMTPAPDGFYYPPTAPGPVYYGP
ncbi:MAG: hypothetical protein M1823_004367 [Watsoniomyces obsoletus]|nr:MAG: hypothetical protein M1823_004367 [Watsoniomyces obsoletus]